MNHTGQASKGRGRRLTRWPYSHEYHRQNFGTIADMIPGHDGPAMYGGWNCEAGNRWNSPWFAFGCDFKTPGETRDALTNGRCSARVADRIDALRNRLEPLMDTADPLGRSVRRRRVWRDEGDEIDPDRANSGRVDCWQTTIRGRMVRTIRLAVNLCLSNTNDVDDFADIAASVCAVADLLTRRGYAVAIDAIGTGAANRPNGSGERHPRWFLFSAPIKRSEDPLDLERIGSIGIPGLARWVMVSRLFRHWPDSDNYSALTPPDIAAIAGVDYVFTNSWTDKGEQKIRQGLATITGGTP